MTQQPTNNTSNTEQYNTLTYTPYNYELSNFDLVHTLGLILFAQILQLAPVQLGAL